MPLTIYPDAVRFISSLDPKRYKQVVSKILSLLSNPVPQDSEQLRGYPFRRVDAGEYRVIYLHADQVVTVVIVGKRNDDEVYRELQRGFKQGG
jgi:mRNA interferase RelE/StbE